jgi:hypothetical protein
MADEQQQFEFHKALEAIHQQQEIMLAQQKLLIAELADAKKKNRKDLWDRLGAIAPILSGTILALGGTFFTLNYNQQQLKLQEAQTIERFIPHLLGDEKSKRAAILAISSLTDTKLAAKVASIFASPGTASALESLAENDTGDRKDLKNALARTLDNMAGNYIVEKRYDDAIATSQKALGLQEQSFGRLSPELVSNLNRLAELYTIHKDFPGAEATLKRSADIQKVAFGPESMQFAAQLRRLSSLYKEEGLDSKSQSLMNQAVAIEQKTPATASSGGIGVAAEPRNEKPEAGTPVSAAEISVSTKAEKSSHSAEASSEKNASQENSPKSNNEPSASKLAAQERTSQSETRANEVQIKSIDSPEAESSRSRESTTPQGRLE